MPNTPKVVIIIAASVSQPNFVLEAFAIQKISPYFIPL
jgi:hypothetical protein